MNVLVMKNKSTLFTLISVKPYLHFALIPYFVTLRGVITLYVLSPATAKVMNFFFLML